MRNSALLAGLFALALTPLALSLELNEASVGELTVIGVSPDLAERLVDYREAHGDFLSSGDVLKVEGMTQGRLNQLRSSLTVDGQRVTTPSGTAPAIPGVSPAIPAHKAVSVSAPHRTRALHRDGRRVGRQHAAFGDETSRQGRGRGEGRGNGRGGGNGGGGGHGKN